MVPPPKNDPDQVAVQHDNWGPQDDQPMGPGGIPESVNGPPLPPDDDRALAHINDNQDYLHHASVSPVSASEGREIAFREKQVKPNKVYIGGLPDHTRREDLQSCFGGIGTIVNIELKVGYGFIEFDTREAAEESVAKYHEGTFMGNKIRVELSKGGGRTAKFAGDPGACFKCGQMGHWARECPNHGMYPRRPMPQREEIMGRPPPRDFRYDYPPQRDFRRPPSPRDYREYPTSPMPPHNGRREYDDFRRGPPPMADRDRLPPPQDYRGRYPPAPDPGYRSYGGPPPQPPAPGFYERYDRRPVERYPSGGYPPGSRARTPPRYREEFERMPPNREYDYRARPPSPPPPVRYEDYRPGPVEQVPPGRYKRRSESPPRYDHPYPGYGNNYPAGGPPPGPPQRGSAPPRDYMPPRNGLDPNSGYRRH